MKLFVYSFRPFDEKEIFDDLKNKYDFEELAHNQIKKYEEEGYECKVVAV